MFVDEINVFLKAGKGGDGCASFRREKYIPKGGPDGGDGGRGGDIILLCDANQNDLTRYYFKSEWESKPGQNGRGGQKTGACGKDLILPVPPGTVLYDPETNRIVAELLTDGERIIFLKGGKGGLGNVHFKSSTHQAPREFTYGELGEEGAFRMELKTIADLGLVGFPNAGKSSLVNAITQARRKTGAYPFTTLHPSVGIIPYPEHYDQLALADIPGLIRGASENRGLGHRFLKHIERCPILVIILDIAGIDGRDPLDDYEALLDELRLYNPSLLEKPRVVVTNKMDEPIASEQLKRFTKKYKKIPVLPVSCLLEEGLEELKASFWRLCRVQG